MPRRDAADHARVPPALLLAALCVLIGAGPAPERPAPSPAPAEIMAANRDRAAEREVMVLDQLEARDIHDRRVLDAMRVVPRHRFVPAELQRQAYADTPLPIGAGQTISQPYIVAFMAQALELRGRERILEIGSGSGYAAAVLSRLGAEVYGIELEEELYQRSAATIASLMYTNIRLRHGDGFLGWPERAPFHAIVLSAAATDVPPPLWDQLAEGGRIIYPRESGAWAQTLVIVTKTPGGAQERQLVPVRFVPLRRR